MSIGLSDNSNEKEKIVVQDENTVVRYQVIEQSIDLQPLKQEVEDLKAELAEPEPSDQDLIAWAKENHAFYLRDTNNIQNRIDELEALWQ